MENDKLADYKDLNEKHGAGHTNSRTAMR